MENPYQITPDDGGYGEGGQDGGYDQSGQGGGGGGGGGAVDPYAIDEMQNDDEVYAAAEDAQSGHPGGGGGGTGASGASANGAAVANTKSAKMNRMAVCGVAIFLLWMTSLSMSEVFVNVAIESPGSDAVVERWEVTYEQTVSEKARHEECISTQMFTCNLTLVRMLSETQQMIQEAREDNLNVIAEAEAKSSFCSELLSEKKLALGLWKSAVIAEGVPLDKWTDDSIKDVCKGTDRKNYLGLLGLGDGDQLTNNVGVLVEQHSNDQDSAVDGVVNNATDFKDYNIDYWKNKTNAIQVAADELASINLLDNNITLSIDQQLLNETLNCISFSDKCSRTNSLRNKYTEEAKNAQEKVDQLALDVEIAKNLTVEYLAAVKRNRDKMKEYYKELEATKETLADISINVKATAPALADTLPGIPADVDLLGSYPKLCPVGCEVQSCCTKFSDLNKLDNLQLPAVPTADDLNTRMLDSGITNKANEFYDTVDTREQRLQTQTNAWNDETEASLQEVADGAPDPVGNYDPPEIDIDYEYLRNQTDELLKTTKTLLGTLETTVITNFPNQSAVSGDLAFLAGSLISKSQSTLESEGFSGSLNLDGFLANLSSFAAILTATDWIFRIFRTAHLVVKYWSQSAVGLPDIDVRKDKYSRSTPTGEKVARCATHPVLLLSIAVLMVSLVVMAMMTFYIPMYEGYVTGCGPGSDQFDGTLLSNNTYSVLYNYVVSEGNSDLLEELDAYEQFRVGVCASYAQSSAEEMRERQLELSTMKNVQTFNEDNLALIYRCTDKKTFGLLEDKYGEDEPQFNYPVFRNKTGRDRPDIAVESKCLKDSLASVGEIQSSVFNCSLMPICTTTCDGPQPTIFNSYVHASGCYTEWLIHATILRSFMTMVVFLCLNLSRVFVVAILSRVSWRALTPDGFTYLATCSRTGKIDPEAKTLLPPTLTKSLTKFKTMTLGYFCIAVLAHVPYIVALVYFGGTVEYTGPTPGLSSD